MGAVDAVAGKIQFLALRQQQFDGGLGDRRLPGSDTDVEEFARYFIGHGPFRGAFHHDHIAGVQIFEDGYAIAAQIGRGDRAVFFEHFGAGNLPEEAQVGLRPELGPGLVADVHDQLVHGLQVVFVRQVGKLLAVQGNHGFFILKLCFPGAVFDGATDVHRREVAGVFLLVLQFLDLIGHRGVVGGPPDPVGLPIPLQGLGLVFLFNKNIAHEFMVVGIVGLVDHQGAEDSQRLVAAFFFEQVTGLLKAQSRRIGHNRYALIIGFQYVADPLLALVIGDAGFQITPVERLLQPALDLFEFFIPVLIGQWLIRFRLVAVVFQVIFQPVFPLRAVVLLQKNAHVIFDLLFAPLFF